jgi:hypothetical protein
VNSTAMSVEMSQEANRNLEGLSRHNPSRINKLQPITS